MIMFYLISIRIPR